MIYVYCTYNSGYSFEWDEEKAGINENKHGVSFKEAVTVFYDDCAIEFHDPDHSGSEDRFLMIGVSERLRVLLLCYCFRKNESVIRIISARKATRKESQFYEENRR